MSLEVAEHVPPSGEAAFLHSVLSTATTGVLPPFCPGILQRTLATGHRVCLAQLPSWTPCWERQRGTSPHASVGGIEQPQALPLLPFSDLAQFRLWDER